MRSMMLLAVLALSPVLLAAAPADKSAATGTWKIDGDVQGTPVPMVCTLVEADDHTLTGTCTGAANDTKSRAIVGEVKDLKVSWHFDTAYEGNPITVSMSGTLSADGVKMTGDMSVAPMDVAGTFTAAKQ